MRGVALWFFVSAVLYVIVGMGFGIWMAASQDHSLAGAHAHLNLLGWVSMAIFGVYYHLVPAAAASRLAPLHFIVATLGLIVFVPGIALAIMGRGEALASIGALLSLASMLIFLVTVVRNVQARPA